MSESTLWKPDRQGFICHWLVSGPLSGEADVSDPALPADQFAREDALRAALAKRPRPKDIPERVRADAPSRLGLPWRFAGGRDGAFVNLSAFYPTLCALRFDAATALVVPEAMTVEATLWSYAAAVVYLNGEVAGGIPAPQYTPIQRASLRLDLRAGENLLYVACETLGVRDTRSVFAVQLASPPECLGVSLPDTDCAPCVATGLALLEGAALDGDRLRLPAPAPEGSRFAFVGGFEPDYARARRPVAWFDASAQTALALPDGEIWVTLEVPSPCGPLTRRFERTEQVRPIRLGPAPDQGANLRRILGRIADVESLSRDGGAFGFPISNLLARRALGRMLPDDDARFDDMLDLIERRVDCADFLVCGLIRWLRHYPVSAGTAARVRQVLVNWRYWMDMDGADAMCFWSENHALMFYSCAMFCGDMYPDAPFPLARRTGRELAAWGRSRVRAWLSDAEGNGFEEFNSAVYMVLTFVALLNLIDYADPDLAARAAGVADRLLRTLARHTFRGGFIAPMGRVYRGVLYPFAQGAMALMNLADGEQPYDFGEGWLGFCATSGYRLPEDLKRLMTEPVATTYTSGNARIVLEKHEDWCLTSVACPREPYERWPVAASEAAGHDWVKTCNERFHGTTDFHPGAFGYQQHLWTAALDGEAILFANHPGANSETGDMRPGYWHGNGVFPALRQEGNMLGAIYRIPEDHPIHYIHLYAPRCRFDTFEVDGQWLFLSKGDGCIGFWSSLPTEPWTGINADCERRIYGDDIACLCVCGGREHASPAAFRAHCRALAPDYTGGVLRAGRLSVSWPS
ncbi:MAG: hypothetical protein IKE17_01995 [Clostridia bacterium]|nr:hypothetical protein [Clostridia bacterium]